LPSAGAVKVDPSPEAVEGAAKNLNVDVSTDKKELVFEMTRPSDEELVFHNGLRGVVRVEADIIGDYRAYSVEPGDIQVQPGADLRLRVHYKPSQSAIETSVRLVIDPFNRTLIIPLKYKASSAAAAP
jgi:hypothetical protein